jgi:hypothetical protein
MLYITYTDNLTDGLGAQYQRLIGIIAVCIYYDCQYIHSSIKHMEHLVEPKGEYLKKIEEHLQIKYNFPLITNNEINFENTFYADHQIFERVLLDYKKMSTETNNLLIITLCYDNLLDKNPEIYDHAMPFLKQIKQKIELPDYISKVDYTKIAIHIRRGDVSESQNNTRYVPLSYYQDVFDKLSLLYPNPYFFIFTEITPGNKDEFLEFEKKNENLPLKLMPDIDTLITLEYLIEADVLVMSKSSFSYVAGLYNENDVYYMDFWHAKLNRWKCF